MAFPMKGSANPTGGKVPITGKGITGPGAAQYGQRDSLIPKGKTRKVAR